MRIVVITGLPASGKTTLAKTEYADLTLFDDPGTPEGCTLQQIADHIQTGQGMVIVDPMLCLSTLRKGLENWIWQATRGEGVIEWIFFRNDPRTCLENSRNIDRGYKGPGPKPVEISINTLSKRYSPPEDTRPCWGFHTD